jgi:hypothetical protein
LNFWNDHGVFFIVFMFFFPRLTLLFSSVPFGGFFWWMGWIFAPRLLVAVLATTAYMHSNPALVIITWLWAATFELFEKRGAQWSLRHPRKPFWLQLLQALRFLRIVRFGKRRGTKHTERGGANSNHHSASSGKYGDDIIDV